MIGHLTGAPAASTARAIAARPRQPKRRGLPKLIATDLDGTLVRSDDTVSGYTHDVLERVRAAGIRIVGATGRGPRLIDLTLRDIPSADYLVLGAGARVVDVTDPAEPLVLRDERFDGAALGTLLAVLEAEVGPLSVLIEAGDDPEAPLWGDPDPGWRYPVAIEARVRADCLGGPVIKGFARHSVHDADVLLAHARRIVPPTLGTVTQAGMGYIEISPPGCDKATGLAVVADALGIDPADVLVFGDMPNDVPMFRWAGYGRVAVASAHPEVIELADHVTLGNDADGVAFFLDRMLEG